jgi:hypothetical protein
VGVQVQVVGPGRLLVTISAQTSPTTPANGLRELRFGATTNAVLDLPDGRQGVAGNLPLPIPTGTQQVSFVVRRIGPGAVMVPLFVVDDCGPWETFVGGGPTAF